MLTSLQQECVGGTILVRRLTVGCGVWIAVGYIYVVARTAGRGRDYDRVWFYKIVSLVFVSMWFVTSTATVTIQLSHLDRRVIVKSGG